MTTNPRKWCLITGVSPGNLGEALAASLLKRGTNIIATSIDTKDIITYLHPEPGSNHGFLITLKMDITSRRAIAKAVETVQRLTDGKLDYLINHEKCTYCVPLLDADIPQAKAQYDVNVWGGLRVVQGFFPLLREAGGMVVNIIGGGEEMEVGRAYVGVGESSRAATRSLTKGLKVEMEPFGVEVVGVDAPEVKVDGLEVRGGGGVGEGSGYWPVRGEVEAAMGRAMVGGEGEDRFDVAERVIGELLGERTMIRRREEERWQAVLIVLLIWIMPSWVLEGLNARAAGLDKLDRTLIN